jgi:(p)ppGpp synthase/HD superfamily hydrolase
MFPCKYCAERFTAISARGLTQHHRKCQAFLKHEEEANQLRKITIASNKIRQTKLRARARVKLEDRKALLGSAALGVSFYDNR